MELHNKHGVHDLFGSLFSRIRQFLFGPGAGKTDVDYYSYRLLERIVAHSSTSHSSISDAVLFYLPRSLHTDGIHSVEALNDALFALCSASTGGALPQLLSPAASVSDVSRARLWQSMVERMGAQRKLYSFRSDLGIVEEAYSAVVAGEAWRSPGTAPRSSPQPTSMKRDAAAPQAGQDSIDWDVHRCRFRSYSRGEGARRLTAVLRAWQSMQLSVAPGDGQEGVPTKAGDPASTGLVYRQELAVLAAVITHAVAPVPTVPAPESQSSLAISGAVLAGAGAASKITTDAVHDREELYASLRGAAMVLDMMCRTFLAPCLLPAEGHENAAGTLPLGRVAESRRLAAFSAVLTWLDPTLACALGKAGLGPELYAAPALSTLFADCAPLASVLTMWDLLICLAMPSGDTRLPLFVAACGVCQLRQELLQALAGGGFDLTGALASLSKFKNGDIDWTLAIHTGVQSWLTAPIWLGRLANHFFNHRRATLAVHQQDASGSTVSGDEGLLTSWVGQEQIPGRTERMTAFHFKQSLAGTNGFPGSPRKLGPSATIPPWSPLPLNALLNSYFFTATLQGLDHSARPELTPLPYLLLTCAVDCGLGTESQWVNNDKANDWPRASTKKVQSSRPDLSASLMDQAQPAFHAGGSTSALWRISISALLPAAFPADIASQVCLPIPDLACALLSALRWSPHIGSATLLPTSILARWPLLPAAVQSQAGLTIVDVGSGKHSHAKLVSSLVSAVRVHLLRSLFLASALTGCPAQVLAPLWSSMSTAPGTQGIDKASEAVVRSSVRVFHAPIGGLLATSATSALHDAGAALVQEVKSLGEGKEERRESATRVENDLLTALRESKLPQLQGLGDASRLAGLYHLSQASSSLSAELSCQGGHAWLSDTQQSIRARVKAWCPAALPSQSLHHSLLLWADSSSSPCPIPWTLVKGCRDVLVQAGQGSVAWLFNDMC